MTELCHSCGGTAELVCGPHEVRFGARSITVETEFMRCGECSETFYLPGQMAAAQRAAADVVRAEEGLLTAREIVALRRQYGLTQTDLEKLLGSGPKTVTRWERGTISQAPVTDALMRVLIESPSAAAVLGRMRGVPVAVAHAGARMRLSFVGPEEGVLAFGALVSDLVTDAEREEHETLGFVPGPKWQSARV